jgi:DNA replication protein DnaC
MVDDDVITRVRGLLARLEMRHAELLLEDLLPDKPGLRMAALETVERVLRAEADRRLEKRIATRIKASDLPDRPTLETFDFQFQPNLDRALVMDLATLAWVGRREDLVLIGQSGVGKSHIAKALCLIACSRDIRVQYTTCADLLSRLHASLADGSLRQALKVYTLPPLLLIDDLGYDTIEQEQARDAQLLYKVLEARHGKRSTIVTSNLPAEKWAEYLGNQYLTVALLDRLLYHATAIVIEGPSYRLAHHRERQQALNKVPADEAGSTTP